MPCAISIVCRSFALLQAADPNNFLSIDVELRDKALTVHDDRAPTHHSSSPKWGSLGRRGGL